ncbi:hypothetical protein BO70DRAFT_358430 [Aspergillus heteromorphus CBS 117.55]|uniref:Alpha 1,6 mannosyltransferase n=1 Tax=Aspergillus heteromorphus CBS 117.55 TaxID=1448321 RepID=A0A317WX47_9EURO|nr:uncharacterized protein BO70DRAFT_358430 [Aspergillus heteromorphus CBS 117.55]PWY90986.1 hypothetical protein BO70DRAFT_358430 [Aspergillus heteromorphus CBS 117.55]
MNSSRYTRLAVLTIPTLILIFLFCLNRDLLPTSINDAVSAPGFPDTTTTTTTTITTTNNHNNKSPPSNNLKNNLKPPRPSNEAISGIPDKIWHSAKTTNLTSDQDDWIASWIDKNPSIRHELLTDLSGEAFVRSHYANTRPDIVSVYEALPIPILKADLLRYLIILAEGGIWSDLDVTCDEPLGSWVPAAYKSQEIDMIVGLEFDLEWRGEGTQVASQFCNWVFAARPSSRNLQAVVDAVVRKLGEIAALNRLPIADLTLDMLPIDVVDVTGPKIMTIALLDGLRTLLGRPVDDRDFHAIKTPTLVGDLLIMPGNSFAAAQNGYPEDQGEKLVTHHYAGSWKEADKEAKERKKAQKDQGSGSGAS